MIYGYLIASRFAFLPFYADTTVRIKAPLSALLFQKIQACCCTLTQQRIDYIIISAVTPNFSSSSMLTWPPPHFTVGLSCNISAPSGKLLCRV
ncbi:hypothetical protein [Massilia sp. BJB1822]|uniref:hypothetical protein n=1 Tax=Massilia sp. BJB1822 TaxID=2744470 RepID=UPI0015948D96|nr:hypothetical protein [Massilia sp. BJB1822]NVE01460.1 hypothetical protein [Massilia sp. BJB1822]